MKEEELIKYIAKGIAKTLPHNFGYDLYDDLYQEGFIGLMAARKDYNPDKQVPFTAYAALRIRGEEQYWTAYENPIGCHESKGSL